MVVFYLGFNTTLPGLLHHTLFFDNGLADTQRGVFEDHTMVKNPAFYASVTSKTDPNTAPMGGDTVFVLIPLSYSLFKQDSMQFRDELQQHVILRIETQIKKTSGLRLYTTAVSDQTTLHTRSMSSKGMRSGMPIC